MTTRTSRKPWHEVVQLRDDLKTGELSLAVFAADLYDVVMQKGQRPVYEQPAEFFALTFPTLNLRELVKDVCHRLDGRSDKAYRKLSVNYGGGKTHTLIALRHLVHDPAALPALPAVQEFEAHIGFKPPKARVAALCFDKIDLEKGVETPGPDGAVRMLRHPWSILAYQLAGSDGLRLIHAGGEDAERDTPPAEPLVAELLAKPQTDGLSTLVLLDEVLMYLRVVAGASGESRGHLVSFFQYLTQAVVKVDRCAMVASLLASDPRRHDELGQELLLDVSEIFGRQMEEDASPVSKEDVAEVLRRRFFTPESIRDQGTFRPHVTSAVGGIASFDEQTRKERAGAEERYLNSYPFHPDLTEIFYMRWTQLDGFQRTRGILRTFAIALRDAAAWDTSPLVGPNVFLREPGEDGLAEAAGELASSASVDTDSGRPQQWPPILEGELEKARAIQDETSGLAHREMEQAVVSVFLGSQPIGQKAATRELMVLLGPGHPDRIELAKALRRWTEQSWFLDEAEIATGDAGPEGELPRAWRLGNRPNLRQMHHDACSNRVPTGLVESQLIDAINKEKALTSGASAAGARVHTLPEKPNDIGDDGDFHYAVLGPKAVSESGKPGAEARRFLDETTSRDRPRVYRNAVVLAAPSRDGLEAARTRVREYLGWVEVRDQLKDQPIDPLREQMLATETEAARRRIPEGRAPGILGGGHRRREQQRPRLQGGGHRGAPVHDHQGGPAGPHPGDRGQLGGDGARRSLRLVARGRGITPRQGPGGRLRALPQPAQDAAAQGGPGHGGRRGPAGDLGGASRAPGPHRPDLLARAGGRDRLAGSGPGSAAARSGRVERDRPGTPRARKAPGAVDGGGDQRPGCLRLLRRRPHREPAPGGIRGDPANPEV